MIEKHFLDNPAEVVFDPAPSYGGVWFFEINNLSLNALKENGVNKFDHFYNETLLKPLRAFFYDELNFYHSIGFISTPNEDGRGRCLKYNKIMFYKNLLLFLDGFIDNCNLSKEERNIKLKKLIDVLNSSNDEINSLFSEAFMEKSRRLKDVLDNELESVYYESALQDYTPYERTMSFRDYIRKNYEYSLKIEEGLLKLGDFFERKIDYMELYQAFDPDTFCLLFAKIIYDKNKITENNTGSLDRSYAYLCNYKNALNSVISENRKYNHIIKYEKDKDGRKIREKYSRWDFLNDFDDLMERHPEAKAIKLPSFVKENSENYKDIALIEKISELYSEDIRVKWEFLPEGTSIKKGIHSSDSKEKDTKQRDFNELIKEINMRIHILENSGFIGRPIKGLDTFSGYYAFIYANGLVVLEKFWENELEFIPAVGCATYILTIDNFIELSKLPRIVLAEYAKSKEFGVKRIFHTNINKWQDNLSKVIMGGTYKLNDVINFLNTLKSDEVKYDK